MPRSLEGLEVSKHVNNQNYASILSYYSVSIILQNANASQEPATVTIMLSYMC
jgi:hypothetical protein